MWYNLLNDWHRYPLKQTLFFPYVLQLLVKRIAIRNRWIFKVPENSQSLSPELLNHGADIKSDRPFRQNIKQILQMAQTRDEPILLLKFIFYFPSDYDLKKFRGRKLDYGTHISPVEVWGRPANVLKGLEAHNHVIESIARDQADPGIYYLDMDAAMPKNALYFNDICHLTANGAAVFATQVAQFVASW